MPSRTSQRTRSSLESSESRFEQATLLEFSKIINSSSDLRFILGHILLTIMGKILSPRGFAALLHEKGRYRIEMVKGFSALGEGTFVDVKRLPRTLLQTRQMNAAHGAWVKQLREEGVAMVLPLFIEERPVGFLAFGERMTRKKLGGKELSYLQSLANLSATAVQKSHAIAALELVNRKLDRKVQELNTLFDLGKEFGALLEMDKLVRLLVYSLMGQVGVNRYVICLSDGPDMHIVASRIDGPPPQGELLASLGQLKGATLVDEMFVKQGVDPRPLLGDLGLKVIVPVQLKGEGKGLILLGERLSREPFSDGDLEFLASLGTLAMIALDNARLFQQTIEKQRLEDELLIAREIQKGLLPSVLPLVPGFEIAAANVSSKQVGGDYYDVIPIEGERYVIAIGDVSGKGTPAALLMANLQATIRALVPLRLPLAELTGRVNDLMCQNTGGNKFVTFFWGIIDPTARTLTYVNAGHNYPYLVHAGGSSDRLEKGGMILGVMSTTSPYEEENVSLRPCDVLVLFTDGVSEAMSIDSEEYGEPRLEAVLQQSVSLRAQELLAAIHQDVLRHARGAQQSDDITMMIVRALFDAA
jgi:sigma-B regulation protein RsbU (phosphoserine phosphatase)